MLANITLWLNQYGYLVLFVSLMIELVAFGIPTEIIMMYAGFLIFQGKLGWISSIVSAGLGAMIGITFSYWIGYRLGTPFFHKYGHKFHMGPERVEKTSQWFGKYGNKLLVVAYFIPGVRHITGYFSGITKIPYRVFSVYAYLGALIWVSTFITLGKILGPQWEQYQRTIEKYLIIGFVYLALVIIAFYVYKKYRIQIFESTKTIISKAVYTFHSLGRVKFFVAGTAVVFLVLFGLMIGLIQDYLANEFQDFNTVTILLIHLIFSKDWTPWMKGFSALASYKILIPLAVLATLWILIKGKDKKLEIIFLLVVMIGGGILEEMLQSIFALLGTKRPFLNETSRIFPGEQSLLSITVYGFSAFLFVRHYGRAWIRVFALFSVIFVSILLGLSRIYFGIQLPNDVMAGFVFGGVWLTFNIILLEVFRILRYERFGN
ncbi:VTT domain-containing protein [Fodinisporobacter ferrooxydans]|uniref:VTT domain-containing protein n=1 Tax=Fodinisporobacter ferrooxydans TaxID=2901836 RepID=A0ABY4CQQ5_9BACL|nr:VTT domain-containing protein [Alicyclobacillaceae bacterium MYW30-H2]